MVDHCIVELGTGITDSFSYRELTQCGRDEKASSILQMKEPVTKIIFSVMNARTGIPKYPRSMNQIFPYPDKYSGRYCYLILHF